MERINKKFSCQLINEEVNATFFVDRILDIDGRLKTKVVTHYACESKEKCELSYNLRDCVCFREMRRTEVEINEIGNHN